MRIKIDTYQAAVPLSDCLPASTPCRRTDGPRLHGFIKKTRKTPAGERELALRRMKEIA